MKRLSIFTVIACLTLLVCSSIFAIDIPEKNPIYGSTSYQGAITGGVDDASAGATVKLKAYVAPYASLQFRTPQYFKAGSVAADERLNFTGAPGEIRFGCVVYSLETNCDVNVDGYGTAFVGNTYKEDKLDTWYSLYPVNGNADANPPVPTVGDWRQVGEQGWVWAPEAFDHKYIPAGAQETNPDCYRVNFMVKTGAHISSQRAGGYTGTYTITVWQPQNLNAEEEVIAQ